MDTKNNWKNQEEKDAYFLKRKKRTKWFVITFIMIMIVMMILFIWLLITLLNNSKKDIQGVWDCENGQMVLQIDKTELSLYGTAQENGMKGNYSVVHYSSSASQSRRKDWTLILSEKETIKNGARRNASNDTIYLSTDSRYQNQLFVEIESTNEQYTCERR